ncbi:SPOR domain-containing protein [Luteimonas sp. MC1782]|uniref:SPOR domain-containing protein n=1 Tax=Luteimonas sp. MC1782 TaxID=2760305 RepID=UPI0016019675|nr:SPOR domain-containing protein [Luteimonas sp. MC1782]MBB1473604.1 SPOR domain-containing protein [Luteimonas sp. MC1782]
MPARALVVLLLMLNFGVATWWLLRPEPLPPTPWVQPADVPRLQLLDEVVDAGQGTGATDPGVDDAAAGGSAAAARESGVIAVAAAAAGTSDGDAGAADGGAPVAPAAVPVATPAPAALVQRCMSLGPFADAGSVAAARAALRPLGAQRMRARDVVDAPRGWRVVIAPQADRAAADALAARIRAAGFDDLLVVPGGDDANGIALGRYGSEPAARRREASLRAAGFPGQAQPLGDARTRHWLDVAAGAGFDAAAARDASGAARLNDLDCATFVADGGAG